MSRSFSSQELARACVKLGWQFDRQSGAHMVFVKPGEPRPIVIPDGRKEVAKFIARNICKELEISSSDLAHLI